VDRCYQLSNRLAFTWKLATLGIPVVLLYLGFTGDEGIRDVGEPLRDDEDWRHTFATHFSKVAPVGLLEQRFEIDGAPVWLLARSREVLEPSPSLTGARDLTSEFVRAERSRDSIRVLAASIQWAGAESPRQSWEVFAELPIDASKREVDQALAMARQSARHFGKCDWCGTRQPRGWMHSARTCQSCAERWLGVVH
jgi:hypothetical protein